jgi:hypothetical protein
MDPLQITVATIGLLSSITNLSMRLNEFRQNYTGAVTEIDGLTRELSDLTPILQRLQEDRTTDSLPANLSADLINVLQNCNRTVVSAEVHLQKAAARSFPGVYWAFSGKRECLQICREIEAHKSTISIALALSST